MASSSRSAWPVDWLIAVAIAIAVLSALVATSREYAMVFDEGFVIDREVSLERWFAGIVSPQPGLHRSDYFAPGALEYFWRFSRREPDGHPPLYALIGLAGWRLARAWALPLTSYRFGPMLLSAATCALIYKFLASRHGRLAALVGVFALVLSPRTFAHAHYAHYDMPVTCLWLLTQIAFVKSLQSPRWIAVFGVLLGLAAATKFTGWFALAPPLAWWAIYEAPLIVRGWLSHITVHGEPRPRRVSARRNLTATKALALGIPLAAIVLYAVQPPWWRSPLFGLERFLLSNLTRDRSIPITSLYFGTLYRFALPWHNTIVLTAITTPIIILILGALGIGCTLAGWRRAPEDVIWPLSWLVLMIIRALPNAPGHDVERLLLPSLASLAVLGGIGVGCLAGRLRARRLAVVPPLLAGLAIGECLLGIGQTYPFNLSYYNVAVGGLPGAERLGFEETYYLDTLGPEFLGWVRRRSEQQPLEVEFPIGVLNMVIQREWGEIPAGVKFAEIDHTEHPFRVLQRNRGIYAALDWWLERHGNPVFVIRRQGVDILRVYSPEEYKQAALATQGQPGPLGRSQRP